MEAAGWKRLKAATTWWKQQAERDLKQQDLMEATDKASINDLMEATGRERDLTQQRADGSNRQRET